MSGSGVGSGVGVGSAVGEGVGSAVAVGDGVGKKMSSALPLHPARSAAQSSTERSKIVFRFIMLSYYPPRRKKSRQEDFQILDARY